MSEHGPFDEAPVTAEEVQAARRLADAIDGDGAAGADAEALATIRLLEAVSEARPTDDIAAHRLRNELTARASRRKRVRTVPRIAAIAAAVAGVALLSVFFQRSTVRPGESVVAAREEAARAAVIAVVGSWSAEYEPSQRIAAVSEQQWRLRLATRLDSERFERLAAESSETSVTDRGQAVPQSTRSILTPGGPS